MTWRDLFRVHEECDWYPMMKEAELEAMAEDIEEHGLRHRVVYRLVQSELGEVAEILDGRNRLEALEIVRLPLLKDNKLNPAYFEKASQKALADIPAYIEGVNLHRRHMDREQRREAILRRLKQDPKRSDRAIGQLVGADHKTVATVRAEAEGRGEIPHVSLRPDSLAECSRPAGRGRNPPSPPEDPSPRWRQQAEETIRPATTIVADPDRPKTVQVGPTVTGSDLLAALPAIRPPVEDIPRSWDQPLTCEQVDPEFEGDGLAFVGKYGHVLAKTAQEWATERYGDWAIDIGHAAKELTKKLKGPGQRQVDLDWLRKPRVADTRKMAEALATLRPIIAEAEAMLARAVAAEQFLPPAQQSGLSDVAAKNGAD